MDLRYTLGIDGSSATRALGQIQDGVGGLHGALLKLGAIGLFAKVIKDGFEFNQTLGDSEAAIAKVLAQFQGLDDVAAKAAAAGAMRQLIDLEPRAAGTLGTLINGFLSTLAASQAAGLSVKENIDLVGRFANAMGNANIPTEQLGQEMRSIVTANIGADSSLAKVLGITNEMIQQAQEAGNVYGFLRDKIGKLGEAGDTAAVRFSSLQSAVEKAEGAFAEGLFQQALDGSVKLTDSLNDNIDDVRRLGAAVSDLTAKVVEGVGAVTDWGRAFGITYSVYSDMFANGISYAEAMANAEEALTVAINDRSTAEQAAAAAAPDTPVSGASPSSGAKDKGADKILLETIAKQTKLDDLKRKTAEDEMTSGEQIAALRERVAAAVEYENTIKSIGVNDTRVALDAEEKRVELQRELAQLEREESRRAAEKAEQARKEVDAHNQSRNNLMGELAILEAQADGQDKKAKALQRQLQIENEKQAIMKEQGAGEEEALRLATRRADLQDKIAKRRGRDANRDENQGAHIGGVTPSNRGFGGLAEFDRMQKGPSSGLGLKVPDLAASKGMQRGAGNEPSSKLLGSGRGQALSDRLARSTAAKAADKGNAKEDPTLVELKAIKEELKRLRTA